jgi:acyl carrier protein
MRHDDAADNKLQTIDATVGTLVGLIRGVAADDLPPSFETRGPETIRGLGLTSVRILEFMVEVEDRLGIEWEEELDPAVVSSFDAMAEYVQARRSR